MTAWLAALLLLQDVEFKEPDPKNTKDELKRRLKMDGGVPDYDIAKEKFRVVVPKEYTGDEPWGLFVWIDAGDEPGMPRDLGPLLVSHKLLAVAAFNSGNKRPIYDRIRLALDEVYNLKAKYKIDSKRIFVSGISGGGRIASMIGVAYADIFAGAFPLCGVNFYKIVPLGGDKILPNFYTPLAGVLKTAKSDGRYVLLTGEKDFNRDQTKLVHEKGFKAEGFKNVLVIDVPGLEHAIPPADWLDKGLDYLDGKK